MKKRTLSGTMFFRIASTSCLLIFAGCEPQQKLAQPSPDAPPVQSAPVPNFPVSRALTDTSGRQVKMQVVGKSVSSLYVIRESDGSKFQIPFSKLSATDQAFFSDYPNAPAPAGFFDMEKKTAEEAPMDAKQRQVMNRKVDMEKLEARNREILDTLRLSTNQIEVRSLNSELDKNAMEIQKLQDQINRLESGRL